MEDVLYTPEEVAAKLKVSRSTIYRFIKLGKIKPYYVGFQIRIPESEIEKMKEKGNGQ